MVFNSFIEKMGGHHVTQETEHTIRTVKHGSGGFMILRNALQQGQESCS